MSNTDYNMFSGHWGEKKVHGMAQKFRPTFQRPLFRPTGISHNTDREEKKVQAIGVGDHFPGAEVLHKMASFSVIMLLGWGTTFRELKVLSKMTTGVEDHLPGAQRVVKNQHWCGGPPSGSLGAVKNAPLFYH